MDDHIITIRGYGWTMRIDLKELAGSAGIRKKLVAEFGAHFDHYDELVLSIPMERAKRLLKLIWTYGNEKDWAACDMYLASNKKLFKNWMKICQNRY